MKKTVKSSKIIKELFEYLKDTGVSIDIRTKIADYFLEYQKASTEETLKVMSMLGVKK